MREGIRRLVIGCPVRMLVYCQLGLCSSCLVGQCQDVVISNTRSKQLGLSISSLGKYKDVSQFELFQIKHGRVATKIHHQREGFFFLIQNSPYSRLLILWCIVPLGRAHQEH